MAANTAAAGEAAKYLTVGYQGRKECHSESSKNYPEGPHIQPLGNGNP